MGKNNGVIDQINHRFDDLKEHVSLEVKPIKEDVQVVKLEVKKNTKFRHQTYGHFKVLAYIAGGTSFIAGIRWIIKILWG